MIMHRSKYDWWLLAILIIATIAGIVAGVGVLIAEPLPDSLIGLFTPVILVGVWWMILGMRYEIAAPDLVIRAGVFRWRVPLAGIRAVRPTHNPLSSPAGSLDRLNIEYEIKGRKRWIMISPRDKAAFIADLRAAGAVFEEPAGA